MSKCDQCPVPAGITCPSERADGTLCGRPGYRELFARPEMWVDHHPAAEEARRKQLLPLVAACPHRGPVLPVSMQRECGCGGELSACRAGKGPAHRAGAVTLRECLACVASLRSE